MRDAKVSDILFSMNDPHAFLREIVANAVTYGYGDCHLVRTGATGNGGKPNYKLEKPSFITQLYLGCGRTFPMMATPSHTFNGRNHCEMKYLDDSPYHPRNWSAATMTVAEVKALLHVFPVDIGNRRH